MYLTKRMKPLWPMPFRSKSNPFVVSCRSLSDMQLSQMQQRLAQRRKQGLYRQEQLLQPLQGGLLGLTARRC